MSENLYNHLIETLKSDERVVSGDKILKNKVLELVYSDDDKLISILVSDDKCREAFFQEAGDSQIFLKEEFINYLTNKQYFQSSYTKYRNKIGLKTEDGYISENKDLELAWPYKDCILEAHQSKEDEGRTEKFWNKKLERQYINTLERPKCLTDFSRYTEDGEKQVGEIKDTDNLFIRGNNLFAIYSLLPRYRGEIQLIYLDPPYNTGSDSFRYNDNFNESTWLTFMKNRLEIARELLSEDGVIFVQIDDNELGKLKILMDEIFGTAPSGKSNFIQYIQIKTNEGAANEFQNPFMPKVCEYGLMYAKNYDERQYKPIWTKSEVDEAYNKFVLNPDESRKDWEISTVKSEFKERKGKSWSKATSDEHYKFVFENIDRIFQTIWPKNPGSGLEKALNKSETEEWAVYERDEKDDIWCKDGRMVRFYSKNLKRDIDGNKIIGTEQNSLWTDIAWTGIANEGGVKLKNGKKPEELLKRIIYQNTDEGDIVLDFFLGSGTTSAVAHKMNRQYIGVEQLDYGDTDPTVRLKNVIDGDQTGISDDVGWNGGGEFVYAELKKLNATYLEDIQSADSHEELDELYNRIFNEALLSYYVDKDEFSIRLDEFESLEINQKKEVLTDILDENQFYLNYADIEDSQIGLSDEKEKELNYQFYGDKND